jgi:hypothetical protein
MKYILENENGFVTYDKYFNYIKSIEMLLPKELYLFASDPDRYNLKSHKTLHDSWIESITINSISNSCFENRQTNIQIKLLGQYHDRMHELVYLDVKAYHLKNVKCLDRSHDDLLFHEIRYENNLIEHEIIFDNDVEILVLCKKMIHNEILLNLNP